MTQPTPRPRPEGPRSPRRGTRHRARPPVCRRAQRTAVAGGRRERLPGGGPGHGGWSRWRSWSSSRRWWSW
jgi:hypothetical protein